MSLHMEETLIGCPFPDVPQLVCNLQQIRQKKDIVHAQKMHVLMCSYGLETHYEVGNYLVPALTECGDMVSGHQVFLRLDHRKEYSWTSMLQGYVDYGKPQDAIDMFKCMQNDECVRPTAYTFQTLIKACAQEMSVDEGLLIHCKVVEEGFESDLFVGSTLVDMYAKVGFVDESQDVFDEFDAKNVVSWNALITGYARSGIYEKVLDFLEKMQLDGVCPNAITFVCALKYSHSLRYGQEVHLIVVIQGFENNTLVGNTLVDFYLKHGLLAEALEIFNELPGRDVVAWTTLMAGYAEHGLDEESLLCLHKMRIEGISPNEISLACSLKACSNIENGQEIHSQIVLHAFDRDVFIADSLVVMYAKCGLLAEAQVLFDELHVQSGVSWAALAEGYAYHSFTEEAVKCLEQMLLENLALDAAVLVCSLKVCGIVGSTCLALMFHCVIVKEGFEEDICVMSTMIDQYSKHGLLLEAKETFFELPVRDIIAWTSLISGYAEHGLGEEALTYWDQMLVDGMAGNGVAYVCLLKACAVATTPLRGQNSHSEICKKGLETDPSVCINLIDMYVKCGCLEEAQNVFDCLQNRDVVAWNTLITGYVEHGLLKEAFFCFEQMKMMGISLNAVTYLCLLRTCNDVNKITWGRDIHTDIAKGGFEGDSAIGNALVSMYAKCGMLVEALEVFDKLAEQTTVSWTTIIAGYIKLGFHEKALGCLEQMQLQGILIDDVTFLCGLRACGNTNAFYDGLAIHAQIVEEGFDGHSPVCDTLVDMYARCGLFIEALDVFSELKFRSNTSWTALIVGYVEHGVHEEALKCFDQMRQEDILPNDITYLYTLKACGSVGALCKLFEIHMEIMRRGFDHDHYIPNALVDWYAKCGALSEASQTFEGLCDKNTVSWNALILGYASQGNSKEVFSLLERMEHEGLEANDITFLGVLNVCSHEGKVMQGHKCFKFMSLDRFVNLSIEHYNCMIDLLGRAGQLNEAFEIMEVMPFDLDSVMLNTMLNACQKWGDMRLAKRASENAKLLKI